MSIVVKNSTNIFALQKVYGKTIKGISFEGNKECMKIDFTDGSFVRIGLTEINYIELDEGKKV